MSGSVPIVVMGVSGSGKSALGSRLAEALGFRFLDADSLHPAASIDKMRAGLPLDDADRRPWLDSVARELAHGSVVVACSALKRRYRDTLREARPDLALVFVHADAATLTQRITARREHFMPPSLLESQFAALEPPTADERPLVLDSRLALAELVSVAARALAPTHHRLAKEQP